MSNVEYNPGMHETPKRRISTFRFRALLAVAAVLLLSLGWATWHFDLGHQPVETLPDLHGKSLEAVIASLGEPDTTEEYKMADGAIGELRAPLYNTYPLDDPKAMRAQIKELQWHRARYHIAVWLHRVNGEWVVLDTCRWKAGVVF